MVPALMIFNGCVDPYEFALQNKKTLVIDALITNELKRHEVELSWAYQFENDSTAKVNGATVTIIDEFQNEYRFQEMEDGKYVSDTEFAAQKGVAYTLDISTSLERNYKSSVEKFEDEAEIDVFAERNPNTFGDDGITIYADGIENPGNSKYFRYTYEETYKIVAPNYIDLDFKLTNYDPCLPPQTYDLEILPRAEQQRICFGYTESTGILQASSIGSTENNVKKFPIRFIPSDDFILSHRYSILVKQYVQSTDAYSYFSKLNDFSSSESVFTDIQPGFLESNISSTSNQNEKVLGYFEVASVSEKRLFFDYIDFYPNESLPKYPVNCDANISRPQMFEQMICDGGGFPTCDKPYLFELINNGTVAYWGEFPLGVQTEGSDIFGDCLHGGIYYVVPRVCGDCTLLGSNTIPEFWIE